MSQTENTEIKKFARRIEELRQQVSLVDPNILAEKTESEIYYNDDGGVEFSLELWGQAVRLPYRKLEAYDLKTGAVLPLIDQTMLLYYFSFASGQPLSGRWISFADLPDGRFYNQAFQGYTGRALVQHFGDQGERFSTAADNLGGSSYPLGSAAYVFLALPRVRLMVVFWQGDEDFPSSFQVLFDALASDYLPTDAYAILGSGLTRKLMKADIQG